MKWTYLMVNIFTIIIPFIFSFHPKIRFHKVWPRLFPALIITAIIFLVWDAWFTEIGVWRFNERHVTGISIYNLPLEEVLFFICIPYACVFTYYCLTRFYSLEWSDRSEKIFVLLFSVFLIGMAINFQDRLYTVYTFAGTAVLMLVIKFLLKARWIGGAFSVYGILLIPFLFVNGVLTGTGLEEPVVIYNNDENLGIRILTIPIEDSVYGLAFYLMNLAIFKRRS
jgi:lycopene cyclase domain-containing protein